MVPATTIRARLLTVVDCDVREELSRVRIPILCLAGRYDRLIPKSAGRMLRRLAPTAIVVELDAPHCLLQCEPRQAAAQIVEFLTERR